VRRYVAAREKGRPVDGTVRRPKIIDPFLAKIEEWVDRSDGSVRADVVHERLQGLGFTGDERTTRRAVAEARDAWRLGGVVIIGRGSPNQGSGCSSTGAPARSCSERRAGHGPRCCSAPGWRGHGSPNPQA
jgi:hypothetical protein